RTVPLAGLFVRMAHATQGWRQYMCTNLLWSGLGGSMTMVCHVHLPVSPSLGWLRTWLMGQRLFVLLLAMLLCLAGCTSGGGQGQATAPSAPSPRVGSTARRSWS